MDYLSPCLVNARTSGARMPDPSVVTIATALACTIVSIANPARTAVRVGRCPEPWRVKDVHACRFPFT